MGGCTFAVTAVMEGKKITAAPDILEYTSSPLSLQPALVLSAAGTQSVKIHLRALATAGGIFEHLELSVSFLMILAGLGRHK